LKKDKSDAVVGCINIILANYSNAKKRPFIQKGSMPNPIVEKSHNSNIFSRNPMSRDGDDSQTYRINRGSADGFNESSQREKSSSMPRIIKGG